MKRWIIFAGIVLLGLAAIVASQRQKVDSPASPAALLYLVADTERELTRMPVHFVRMSDAEEIRIGNTLAYYYSSRERRDKTPENTIIQHYLTRVGTELATHAHRVLPYKFHYIPDADLVNAFALPGGHVYVGGGLVALMDSEDELAAVVGHEIEHIDHYHCSDRVQQEQALRRIPLGGLVAIPIEVFEAGYSKDQELEATARERAWRCRRDTRRLEPSACLKRSRGCRRSIRPRQRIRRKKCRRWRSRRWRDIFRSHPLPSERIAQVQKMIASEGWTPRAERDLRIAYLFATAKAQPALDAKNYTQAEQLANQSLRLRPDQPRAFQVLSTAQFAQAKIFRSGGELPQNP